MKDLFDRVNKGVLDGKNNSIIGMLIPGLALIVVSTVPDAGGGDHLSVQHAVQVQAAGVCYNIA